MAAPGNDATLALSYNSEAKPFHARIKLYAGVAFGPLGWSRGKKHRAARGHQASFSFPLDGHLDVGSGIAKRPLSEWHLLKPAWRRRRG
jgi:hypothetical protein